MEKSLKTKKLLLTPLTDGQLEGRMAAATDAVQRGNYERMLAGCRADGEHRLWYTAWEITLRENGESVGELSFQGPVQHNEAGLFCGVDKPFRRQGYATEAARTLIDWAFSQDSSLFFITAVVSCRNAAALRVLEKLHFRPEGEEWAEERHYVLERPANSWMSIYMCLGLAVGLSLGNVIGNSSVGMCLGLGVGLCLGSVLDNTRKKRLEEARKARQERQQS